MQQNSIPYGYCHCGCGQKTNIPTITDRHNRTVKGQPKRFIRGHNCTKPIVDRFWKYTDKRDKDDCWEWQGAKANREYGVLSDGKANKLAHRLSYEIHNGPIPDGLHVCHHCDNPSCVNPAHLFLGTDADNAADKVRKGRQLKGEKAPRSKLTKEQIPKIRQIYASGNFTHRELGVMFNVHGYTIGQVVRRETWKHI